MSVTRVAVVADDLIWSTRLVGPLRAAGVAAVVVRDRAGLAAALPEVDATVIDMTARAYDGVELIRDAMLARRRTVAVAQHDDREIRRRAIEAGAERVFAYRQLAERGADVLGLWLASDPTPRIEHADEAGSARP